MIAETNPVGSREDMYRIAEKEWKEKLESGNYRASFAYRYLINNAEEKKAERIASKIEEGIVDAYINGEKLPELGRLKQYEILRAVCIARENRKLSDEETLRDIYRIIMSRGRNEGADLKRLKDEICSINSGEEGTEGFFSEGSRLYRYLEVLKVDLVRDFFRTERNKNAAFKGAYNDQVAFAMALLAELNRGNNGVSGEGEPYSWMEDEGYLGKCKKTYEIISRRKSAEGIFFPIGFDPRTGCGVYFVGKKHMENNREAARWLLKERDRYCFWGTGHFFGMCGWNEEESLLDIYTTIEVFPTVEEAIKAVRTENMDAYFEDCDADDEVLNELAELTGEEPVF